jgi:prepilin-type N-terminal cleavage/methylation domain-containing protein
MIRIQSKGFTIIELLVVIAIIGLLSSVVLVSLDGARKSARDAIRKQDLRNIQIALEAYYHLNNATYPPEGHWCDSSIGTQGSGCPVAPAQSAWGAGSDLQDLVTAGLLKTIPVDPINNSTWYYNYEPDGAGQGSPPCTGRVCRYGLYARLESGGLHTLLSVEQSP